MKRKRKYRGGYQFAGLTERSRELRQKQTPAEDLLWQVLRNRKLLGFKFRRQHQYGDYIADFYCHEARLVIECDGPVHDGKEACFHDQKRDAYMMSMGLKVMRFNNNRVLYDTENVLAEISSYLLGIAPVPSLKRFPLSLGRGGRGRGN